MKVLLSIKPEFADKIFSGTKKYEFRRSIFKKKEVKTIVVYASSPVQKIIGEFEIETIIKEELNRLWELTKDLSGISEDYFFEYFRNKENGFAIKIKNPKRYNTPLLIREDFNATPPQSFMYLTKEPSKPSR
jgi:predicted transcriptional regulator